MSGTIMELADKWDRLKYGPAGVNAKFRKGYEQALKDCAKELRIASGISIEVSVKGGEK